MVAPGAETHVGSEHFRTATAMLPGYLVETQRVVAQTVDQEDWSELGEMEVR